MGGYEICLPVGATNLRLIRNNVNYLIDLDEYGFTRSGEGGASRIVSLFGGTEFEEEYLDGSWRKNWHQTLFDYGGQQSFTAIVNTTTNVLELEGETDSLGTMGYGWLGNINPIPLFDKLEMSFALTVPIADTGGTASRDIQLEFYLCPVKPTQEDENSGPLADGNWIKIQIFVDEGGYIHSLQSNINGATSTLFDGSTYDDASAQDDSLTDLYTIWRLVFDKKPGTSGSQLYVYLRQSDSFENALASEENELTSSPYDMSEMLFSLAHPFIEIGSQNQTYFDSGGQAQVGFVEVDYSNCQFEVKYDTPDDNILSNAVQLWDGDPDSGGIRVFDTDHVFTDDIYLQNGFIRLKIDELAQHGVTVHYFESGTGYTNYTNQFYPRNGSTQNCQYPKLMSIDYISNKKVSFTMRWLDDATEDDDYFVEVQATLNYGSYSIEFLILKCHPKDFIRMYWYPLTSEGRFGYIGDEELSDDDLALNANNTATSDNFMINFDNTGEKVISGVCYNKKPDVQFYANEAGYLYADDVKPTDIGDYKFWLFVIPFEWVSNTFTEGEDMSGSGGSPVVDASASDGYAMELDIFAEYVEFQWEAGADIAVGRYMVFIRARNDVLVDNDMSIQCRNTTDIDERNETNAYVECTLANTYGFYTLVFDVTQLDADDGDTITFEVAKHQNDGNSIYVDYLLIIPLSNGESWTQDLAHNAMRNTIFKRKVRRK